MGPEALRRWARLARRAGEVLVLEGPEGFLARARRRLSSDDRRVFGRYSRWLATHDLERPPGGETPLVSVVTPVKDPPVEVLRELARSVLGQEGARVEWCVADDASARADVRAELERLAARAARQARAPRRVSRDRGRDERGARARAGRARRFRRPR
jgi:hypothetical protein